MLLTLTHSEMLKLWRTRAGLEPWRTDCTVERMEGIDADAIIEPRMRAWYLHLLDTALAELLPVDDAAASISLAGGCGTLPPHVRRLLALRLSSWSTSALPASAEHAARIAALACNPYSAPGTSQPACTVAARRISVAPWHTGDTVEMATAVSDPAPTPTFLTNHCYHKFPTYSPNNDKRQHHSRHARRRAGRMAVRRTDAGIPRTLQTLRLRQPMVGGHPLA